MEIYCLFVSRILLPHITDDVGTCSIFMIRNPKDNFICTNFQQMTLTWDLNKCYIILMICYLIKFFDHFSISLTREEMPPFASTFTVVMPLVTVSVILSMPTCTWVIHIRKIKFPMNKPWRFPKPTNLRNRT